MCRGQPWHLVGRGQGCCWTSYNVRQQWRITNYLAQHVSSAKAEKLWYRSTELLGWKAIQVKCWIRKSQTGLRTRLAAVWGRTGSWGSRNGAAKPEMVTEACPRGGWRGLGDAQQAQGCPVSQTAGPQKVLDPSSQRSISYCLLRFPSRNFPNWLGWEMCYFCWYFTLFNPLCYFLLLLECSCPRKVFFPYLRVHWIDVKGYLKTSNCLQGRKGQTSLLSFNKECI